MFYVLQAMNKIMERVVEFTHFFINAELRYHLPVTQLVSFWNRLMYVRNNL